MFFLLSFALFTSSFAAKSKLYGLAPNLRLASIDPTSGNMTVIGRRPITHEAPAKNLASLDSKNGIYYYIGVNMSTKNKQIALVGLSIKCGSIIREVPLPFEYISDDDVGIGQTCDVEPETGDVFVTGRPRENVKHVLLRVNPRTGRIRKITRFGGIDVLSGSHGYDPENKVLWVQTASPSLFRLYGLNVETGKKLFDIEDFAYFSNMVYDPKTNKMLGAAYDVGLRKHFLATLDSTTGKFGTKGLIEGYGTITSLRAFDVKNRLFYCYLQRFGSENDDLFYLVATNVDTMKTVEMPHPCNEMKNCPWAIECLN